MATFTKIFKSKAGYIVGQFPNLSNLSLAHYDNAPDLSDTELDVFKTYYYNYEHYNFEWLEYYAMSGLLFPSSFTASDVALILAGDGATTEGNAKPIFVIPTTQQNTDLCLMGYSDSTTVIRIFVAKRVLQPNNTYQYTKISLVRPVSYTNSEEGLLFSAGVMTNPECGEPFYAFGAIFKNVGACESELFVGTETTFLNVMGADPSGQEYSPEFGPIATPEGGYNPTTPETGRGTFDDHSDEIALDAKPSVGVTSAGFINVYKITIGQLANLGEKIFPHFLPAEILADPSLLTTPETIVMFLKSLYGTMISPVGSSIQLADNLGVIDVLMNGKLIDYILDCHIIPTSVSGATVEGLRIGYRQFNDIQLAKANEDYVDVDCGTLYIKEFYGNFLDYSGNLSVQLYLPFVGYVPIDNEFWNNSTLKVVYRFNIVDGSFQAKVFATRMDDKGKLHNSLVAQYGGVCCVHFPITGLQYSNVVAGLVNGTAGAVTKGMSGDIGGAVTNAMNMAMLRPDAPSSNGYNASSGFLAHRTPYLVIKMPMAQFSERYPKEQGLPLNVTNKLSNVHGFTVVDNPVLNIDCNDKEYREIVQLLKEGVILP